MPAQCPNIQRCPSEQGLWTPSSGVPNLALWLDAADPSTITVATGVSEWRDKSGNGRHFTQATGANQPANNRNGINGLGSIAFNGTAQSLQRTPEAWAFQYPITAFIVFRVAAFTNVYNSLFEFFTINGPANAGWSDLIKSNGKSAVYSTNTAGVQPNYDGTGSATYVTNQNYIFTGIHQNNSLVGLQNGNADGSNAGSYTLRTNLGASPLYIGSSPMFSRYTDWQIGEVIITNNAALSTSDRQKIEGYLAWKWGVISQFSEGNPYRFAPPRDNRILTRKRRSLVLLAGASGGGVSSPTVSPGFASRSATAYSAAIQTNVTPNFAQSTAAAFNVTIAQNIACTVASRTAEAYSVTLNQVVSPTPALRTAVAYDLSLPQTVTVGFASSTAVAYPATINQTILATFADRTATAYTVTIPQRILPTPASREATGFTVAISQTLIPNFVSREATGFTVVISQTVPATYASRTAEGYSPTVVNVQSLLASFAERTATAYPVDIKQTLIPNFASRVSTAYPLQIPLTIYPTFADRASTAYSVTIHQRILPTPASREAAGFTIAIKQTLIPNFASRVATAYPAQIPLTVYPTFANRTATGYNPNVVIVQVVTAGFAGRTAAAYPTSISQQVRPSVASRTAEGYTANVAVHLAVSPTPALRASAAYNVYLNQNILTSFASRSASGYNCTVAVSQYLNAGFAERTSEAYPANVFPTTYLTLLVSFAERTSSAYPAAISQVNPTSCARRVPVAYPVHKLVRGTPPVPVPNVYVPEKVNLVLPKNFPVVRRAIVRRSSTKSLLLRWSILPTDYDMGDIRFVVFRSQGNSGPWTQIGVAEEGAFHWTDLDVNSPWALNSFYYILRTVSISGKGFKDSEPLYCSHDPDNIATELVRKKQVFLRTRAGVNVAFLCRKSWGAKCARCWDEVRKAPTDPDCPDCFGTGYAGGYLKPFYTLALLTPSKEIEIGGKFRDGTIYAELGPDPYVDPGDVLVDVTMNLRYKITAVQQASHRGYVVSQILTLAQCDENDVVYKVNIDETLESKRGESYVVGAVSGATL